MWYESSCNRFQSTGRSAVPRQPVNAPVQRTPGHVGVRQVAREAGVSTATVSRAFNVPERVTPAIHARVMEAARRLDYMPDPAARALSSQRSQRIGALIPTLDNSIFAHFIEALQKRLRKAGYGLLIASYGFDPKQEVEEAKGLLEGGVDGLVLAGERREREIYEKVRARGVPYVLTSILSENDAHPSVGYDNRAGGAALARYLTDLGHRHIGMIQGPAAVNDRAVLRAQGVRDVLEERGIPLPADRVIDRHFSIDEGRTGLRHLMTHVPELTAIICGNDILAIGALLEAQALGLAVPDYISIAGYDGLDLAARLPPGITTIDVPTGMMGTRVAETLLTMLDGGPAPRTTVIETSLVVRGSTAAPRALN